MPGQLRSTVPRIMLACAVAACRPAAGRETAGDIAAWHDPSPHLVSFVTVAPGVRLEVLDWGGNGPPLVFLSGLQDVAHGFDAFAPRFTDTRHVLAITRRGYGASSQPATGYDLDTRVADLAAVLDSLHLARMSLAGHSIAGDELTAFAARHPERVDRLVYLDAAFDHSEVGRLLGGYPWPPPMGPADSASPAAVQAYTLRVFGMRIPEAQLRAIGRYDARTGRLVGDVTPASIDSSVIAGAGHPDYAAVQAPALVLSSRADSATQLFAWWDRMDDPTRAKARAFTRTMAEFATAEGQRARRGLARATFIEYPGANHYLFDSNEAEVTQAMRAFLAAP